MGGGLDDWQAVIECEHAAVRPADRTAVHDALIRCSALGQIVDIEPRLVRRAPFQRILELCPCLYSQLSVKPSGKGIVHLCEITLGTPIRSNNVERAFLIQHPDRGEPYRYPPTQKADVGSVTEALCAEVLTNHRIPAMEIDDSGWPNWESSSHLSLNLGKVRHLKLYGDILIPCVPHNLLVSVKSETARERFVISGNRLESIGFGFFNDPSEFWTTDRMNLLKRWGFLAIYMPQTTFQGISEALARRETVSHAININGRPLYRPLQDFGNDLARVAGKSSVEL